MKFVFSCVGGVDVFADVIDSMVIEELVSDLQRVSLVSSEGRSVGTIARWVVGGFAAESRYNLLDASGLAEASAGVVTFVCGVEKERIDGFITVVVPGLEFSGGPGVVSNKFGPPVTRDALGVSFL